MSIEIIRSINILVSLVLNFAIVVGQQTNKPINKETFNNFENDTLLRGTGYFYPPAFLNVTGAGAFPDTTAGIICDCDGTGATDATNCLQLYLDSAFMAGEPLLIPYTDDYYKISESLYVNGSVIGHGGMTKIVQISQKSHRLGLLLENGMSGWIYNLHIIGPYDSTADKPSTEWGHNVGIRAAQNVTIMNCILETALGDGIGTDGGTNGTSYNILITNNYIIDSYRNGIATTGVDNHWAIMNNRIEYYTSYVNPIDFEPHSESSYTTNMEVGYNEIISPKPAWNDHNHFYDCVVKLAGWFDKTPGKNFFLHHNWGNWGVPFFKIGSNQNGVVYWKNVESMNNIEGDSIPAQEPGMVTAPTDLSFRPLNRSTFELTWTPSTTNVGVKGYLVYQRDSLLGITENTTYEVTELNCGSTYSMTLRAYDSEGNTSLYSDELKASPKDCSGDMNLLSNPGFELNIDTGWFQDLGGKVDRSDSVSRNGIYSLQIGPNTGGRAQLIHNYFIDSSYTLQAWSKVFGDTENSSYIGVEIRDSSNMHLSRDSVILPNGSARWIQNNLTFTVPRNAGSISVFIYQKGINNENVVFTDDWAVLPYIPVTSIGLDKSAASVPLGLVTPLKAVIHPSDAINQNVNWSTSNSSIAVVSQEGIVSTFSEGKAIITAVTVDGKLEASCIISVTTATRIPIDNPGIENGFNSGWTRNWGGITEVVTESVHSGEKAMSVGPGAGGRAQRIRPLMRGGTYTLSAWGILIGNQVDTTNSYLGIDFSDASGKRLFITPSVVITDNVQWKQYQVTFTVPQKAAKNDIFLYQNVSSNQSRVHVDDWGLMSGWEPLEHTSVQVVLKESHTFRLYPNPLTGTTLHIEGMENGTHLFLYDMTGRKILTQKLEGMNIKIINLEQELKSGIFIVKIIDPNEIATTLLISDPE